MVDTFNSRIQKFSSDGKFINSWGSLGIKEGQFLFPQDIAIDSMNNIYISDIGNGHPEIHFMTKFLSEHQNITEILDC